MAPFACISARGHGLLPPPRQDKISLTTIRRLAAAMTDVVALASHHVEPKVLAERLFFFPPLFFRVCATQTNVTGDWHPPGTGLDAHTAVEG